MKRTKNLCYYVDTHGHLAEDTLRNTRKFTNILSPSLTGR